jgi:uncharacterized protein (TIGR03437 family)
LPGAGGQSAGELKCFLQFFSSTPHSYSVPLKTSMLPSNARFFSALLLFAFTASSANSQCYEFSGSGATIQITITSFVSRIDNKSDSDGGYTSKDTFVGNNSLTAGGTTETTQSTANTPDCVGCLLGSAVYSYDLSSNLTTFTFSVPANGIPGSGDAWFVNLGGLGNQFPTGVLPSPQAFPQISNWPIEAEITVAGGGGTTSTDYPITAIGSCASSSGSPPAISGVVSASAFGGFASVAPGSWVEIYGANLGPDTEGWTSAEFTNGLAPTSLNGVSVSIGAQAAFVDYISAAQVNAQLPSNIATGGPLQLTVTNADGTSAPVSLTVNATEPGLLAPASFKVGANQYVVAQHSDGSYVLPVGAIAGVTSSPAKPGETVVIYGVGFGSVVPTFAAGLIVTKDNTLALSFELSFGQTPAHLNYDGLAPSFVGLYQFNVEVPTVASNDLVPLTFSLGGAAGTQKLFTAVQQ